MQSMNEPSFRLESNRYPVALHSTLSQLKMKEHMEKKRAFVKPPKQQEVSSSRLDSTTSRAKNFEPVSQQSVYNDDVRRLVESRLIQTNSHFEDSAFSTKQLEPKTPNYAIYPSKTQNHLFKTIDLDQEFSGHN